MTRRELLKRSGASIIWAAGSAELRSDEEPAAQQPVPVQPPLFNPGSGSNPGSFGDLPIDRSVPSLSPGDPTFMLGPSWNQGADTSSSLEFASSDPSSMRLMQSPGESLYAGNQNYDVFVYAVISAGAPGPLRPGGEIEFIAGSSSRSGFYGSLILAGGGEVGGEANYIGKFGGIDLTISAESVQEASGGDWSRPDWSRLVESEPIEFNFGGAGAEVPVLGGLGATLGRYYTDSGETGLYQGVQFHVLGFSVEFGFGGYRSPFPWGPNAVCRP